MTATITSTIEFQLVDSVRCGIVGRLFIPSSCRGMGKVKGTLVYDSDRAGDRTCNHKSRTIEFIGTLQEYERCASAYGTSNLPACRVRTVDLLQQLRFGTRVIGLPELPVEPVVEPVVEPAANPEILDIPGEIKAVEVTLADYLAFSVKELKEIAHIRGIRVPLRAKKQELASIILAA